MGQRLGLGHCFDSVDWCWSAFTAKMEGKEGRGRYKRRGMIVTTRGCVT